ncbi:MAG: hypothetical protein SangKO_093790 [Sandaracinaceae bacterium]
MHEASPTIPSEPPDDSEQSAVRARARGARHKIAGGLDALVRATRSGASTGRLAESLRRAWLEHADVAFEVRPSGISIDGRLAVPADAQTARWALPAFMVGVRSIALAPPVEAPDLERFAEALARLEVEEESLRAFGDWLFEDGAEGLKVELHASFVEVLEHAEAAFDAERGVRAARGAAALPTGITEPIAAVELDRAALLPELGVDVARYADDARARRFELTGDDLRSLEEGVSDPATWSRAELRAVLEQPELRALADAHDVSRRLLAWLRERVEARALTLLTELLAAEDEAARRVSAALDAQAVAGAIVEGLRFERGADELGALLRVAPVPMAREILHGLFAEGATRSDARYFLTQLAYSFEPQRWLAVWAPERVDSAEAIALTRVLIGLGLDVLLADMLALLPPTSASAALEALDPERLPAHEQTIERLARQSVDGVSTLVGKMTHSTAPEVRSYLGDLLRRHDTLPWDPREFSRACRHLGGDEEGREVLVDLSRSTRLDPQLRLSALNALRGDTERLGRAAAWRLRELVEPPELRAALKRIRKTLSTPPRPEEA